MDQFMQLLVGRGGGGHGNGKSAKGPDTAPFKAERAKVAEDFDRFKTALTLKFEAEADRFTTAKGRVSYVFTRLEGRAAAMCVVGLQTDRHKDWTCMMEELGIAFGELGPGFAWDKRRLNLKQGARQSEGHGPLATRHHPSLRPVIHNITAEDPGVSPPQKITKLYPENTIMEVIKSLHGIAEAGTHWWATYFNHHRNKGRRKPRPSDVRRHKPHCAARPGVG